MKTFHSRFLPLNFRYVADVSRAFDAILHYGAVGQVINIGTPNEVSNLDVAKQLIDVLVGKGNEQDYLTFVRDRDFNDRRYYIDSTKLRQLGWREEVTWEDGLQKTINWYQRKETSAHWGDISSALLAHPLKGTPQNRKSDAILPGKNK